MKQAIINILKAISVLLVFASCFGMIYAGAYVLDDGLGGCKFPGIFSIFVGFLFFIIFIANYIDSACARF